MTQIWKIEDMSCAHCVAHVKKGLSQLPGVTEVLVSLQEGNAKFSTAKVTVQQAFTAEEAKVIVDELGYTFTGFEPA